MPNYIQSNQVVQLPAPAAASTNLISVSDSGKILMLPAQTAIQTFTLPLPAPGLCYKIIAGAVVGFAVTIATNPASLFFGNLTNVSTTPVTTAVTGANVGAVPIVVAAKNGATNVIFNATARPGDYVEMVSDGNFWYVNGMSTTGFATATTVAATLLLAGLN